mmetsp:Transcript_32498/g.87188  ORF Transcript_32498/g.87188 Transcript_32498/m.87188 type:complete len:202 (+) Transcript_32498:108-713(+)
MQHESITPCGSGQQLPLNAAHAGRFSQQLDEGPSSGAPCELPVVVGASVLEAVLAVVPAEVSVVVVPVEISVLAVVLVVELAAVEVSVVLDLSSCSSTTGLLPSCSSVVLTSRGDVAYTASLLRPPRRCPSATSSSHSSSGASARAGEPARVKHAALPSVSELPGHSMPKNSKASTLAAAAHHWIDLSLMCPMRRSAPVFT